MGKCCRLIWLSTFICIFWMFYRTVNCASVQANQSSNSSSVIPALNAEQYDASADGILSNDTTEELSDEQSELPNSLQPFLERTLVSSKQSMESSTDKSFADEDLVVESFEPDRSSTEVAMVTSVKIAPTQEGLYMNQRVPQQPHNHQSMMYAGLPSGIHTKQTAVNRHLALPMHRYQMGFLDLLLEGYDNRVWPTYGTKEPTTVMVNMYINSISSICASEMDYTMDIYLRQSWIDPRLTLAHYGVQKSVYLNGENIISRIWKPDLFFRNVKEANFHAITVPNMLIKIGPRGEVLHSSRLTLKLSCQMSFQNYPLDRQKCHIIMGSYSYTADVVRLNWMNRAILLDHKMEIPDYYLTGVSKSNPYFKHYIVIGAFSFLNATFTLQRQNGYHMVNTYLPTCLIVMISWVSFWLNVDASPARTTLGVTTLLALTTVASGVRRQLPPVSYIKAVDIWIGACSVMVFGTLLEFALVNYLSRSKLKPAHLKKSMNVFHCSKSIEMDVEHEISSKDFKKIAREDMIAHNLKKARMVDRACRVIFPVVFFIFNLMYWFYYLYISQKN